MRRAVRTHHISRWIKASAHRSYFERPQQASASQAPRRSTSTGQPFQSVQVGAAASARGGRPRLPNRVRWLFAGDLLGLQLRGG
eukprot:1960311-Pyramimonas_sp.AAC.1